MNTRPCVEALAAVALCTAAAWWVAPPAKADDLFRPNSFSALASDRRAARIGDSLTVTINETSSASNSNRASSAKSSSFLGSLGLGSKTQSAQLGLNGGFDSSGEISHSGKMLAQLSVVVDGVLPNGDLHVSGNQSLNINGEHTRIRLSGRVRPADISQANSIPSTDLADAVIDYDGKGFVSNGAKPGVVSRIFAWLGLI